jgi:fatty acid desaturase
MGMRWWQGSDERERLVAVVIFARVWFGFVVVLMFSFGSWLWWWWWLLVLESWRR